MIEARDYSDFANAVEEKVDMDDIRNKEDLRLRLRKFFGHVKPSQPTLKQIDALGKHYGVEGDLFDEYEKPKIPKAKKPRRTTARVKHIDYPIQKRVVTFRKPKTEERVRAVREVVTIKMKGFKKRQIRDVKTGRIIKWVD